MALKNIANANPLVFDAWFDLTTAGQINRVFPSKGSATSFRQQMNQLRRLAESERPADFKIWNDFHLSVGPSPDGLGGWVVVGEKSRPLNPDLLPQATPVELPAHIETAVSQPFKPKSIEQILQEMREKQEKKNG